MPTLVKFSGDEDFRGIKFRSYMDQSVYLSFKPCVEVLCPPRKRLRGNPPPLPKWEPKQKKQKFSITLDMLPEECLFEIFRRLPEGKDRSICACVSKKWLMLQSSMRKSEFKMANEAEIVGKQVKTGNGESLNKQEAAPMEIDAQTGAKDSQDGDLSRCLEGNKATDTRLAAISIGLGSRGGLGKLKIRGNNPNRGVSDVGFTAVAYGCPGLRSLSLWDCPCVTDKALFAIAKGCPQLEKLDLLSCSLITDAGILAIVMGCPNLSTLNIENCPGIGSKSIKSIGQHCDSLKVLSIQDCILVGDEGFQFLNKPRLTKVKLQGLRVGDRTLEAIGNCSDELSKLVLLNLPRISQQGILSLEKMKKLKVLSVTSVKGLTDVSLASIGEGCTGLKTSSFKKCDVSDAGLKAFTKAAASLQNLLLEECNFISIVGLIAAVGSSEKLKVLTVGKCLGIRELGFPLHDVPICETLKSLTVKSCPGFGNGCLGSIGLACPQIRSVNLGGLALVSDDGVLSFLGSVKSCLVKLDLSGCVEITDRAVFVIAHLFGQTLESLNFEGCKKLTDQSLKFISSSCQMLQELDMSECSVTDSGLASLAITRPSLKILSLSGCPQITDQSLAFIRRMSESLHGLNLQRCSGISCTALDLLQGNLWRCDILA